MAPTCLAVIPARFPSTRFPGKPLKEIGGKALIQRVWEQASQAKSITKLVIASDDQRILDKAKSFGADTMMTSSQHETGTDRVAEVSKLLETKNQRFDLVANVQGDLPFINPLVIDQTIKCLADSDLSFGMSTVGTPITDEEEYLRASAVKVVLGKDNAALYFSRAPIPHWRDRRGNETISESEPFAYKHLGLYVFRPTVLYQLSKLERTFAEKREALEQLRALCSGIKIRVTIASKKALEPSIEIDTPEDLERAEKYLLSLR